ncbi:MAG TPA: aldo/keto reductase [Tepidisphaeraceae bacterium]|nr:aldo/keto reductase [Tepidisphaeraceae bacterium]
MEKRTFGRTGLQVSVLGYGGAPAAFLDSEQQQTAKMIGRLLDAGMNVIDTAMAYPGSEEFLGKYLSGRRKDFVLISKCGQKIPESDTHEWSYETVSRSIDRSLRLLKTDFVDVMLLHSCDLNMLKKGDAFRALADAREKGKIRFAGYSGDNDAVAWAAAQSDVAVVEMSLNMVDQINIDVALPVTKKHNVGLLAKRPIANAAWKDISQQPGMYKSYASEYTERFKKMGLTLGDLGYNDSDSRAWAEIALRFTLSFPEVHCAIIGTTSARNAQANLAAAEQGPLPSELVKKIRDAFHKADAKKQWRGLT